MNKLWMKEISQFVINGQLLGQENSTTGITAPLWWGLDHLYICMYPVHSQGNEASWLGDLTLTPKQPALTSLPHRGQLVLREDKLSTRRNLSSLSPWSHQQRQIRLCPSSIWEVGGKKYYKKDLRWNYSIHMKTRNILRVNQWWCSGSGDWEPSDERVKLCYLG